MKSALIILAVLAGVALVVLLWAAATYNRLVTLRAHIRDSWAGVEVELKRRYELIPNLVEVVRAYAAHERETLERVIEARDRAAANHGPVDSQARDEADLVGALRRLTVLAEDYPELKADRHFLRLHRELVDTEDRIAAARRFYNGNVRTMNTLTRVVPSNIIANLFGFEPASYFQIEDAAARETPAVTI